MTQRTGRAARRILGLATAGILAATGVLATGGSAQAAYNPGSATIWNDEPLYPGWHVDSPGPYSTGRMIMQSDGNLVGYVTTDGNWDHAQPVWSSNTVGCGAKAVMQVDGNLVVYAADGHACWWTNTFKGSQYNGMYATLDAGGHLYIWGDDGRYQLNGMIAYGAFVPVWGHTLKVL
ncbi:hypothetical protein ACFZB9_31870 [Kitasatospora sp. NPDC008050]|uniref:hypothetical protein n=1 Tax=Kitasatospora sp. NPDC008050 TaxID=3364021 RepID=UPI0036EC46E4